MRTIITITACILMVTLSFWVVSIEEPTIETVESRPAFTEATTDEREAAPIVTSIPLESSTQVVTASLLDTTSNFEIAVKPMKATDISSLPKEMQQEIRTLSGRNDSANVISEVSPGVFLNSGGPRVVPVAVINSDGTVSTHEY